MKVGSVEVEIIEAVVTRVVREDDVTGDWLVGSVTVAYRGEQQAIPVCAWSDTDDDGAEWSVAVEGAVAIAALAGVDDPRGIWRGSFLYQAFPEECQEIGEAVCARLRESADRIERGASPGLTHNWRIKP